MSAGPPDSDLHARIKALFLDVLACPPAERTSLLADIDEGLRAEVETLLAAHDEAENLGSLSSPAFDLGDARRADPLVGRQIGPWRLEERIGEGGMGTVYRAERADGAYERTVAIKLLRPGSDVRGLAERLHAERNVLARLEHPHIARLYDGGVTDAGSGPGQAGLPYLAMELVDGMPITGYCETRELDTNARIGLFLQVCDAVAYAHRNLIVHRDLKPSNILVTSEGEAKLLDFGIAKLLEETGEAALLTRTGTSAMTPPYAAPEQIRNESVTTAADVYSLGALLYELLANRRPYNLSEKTAAEIKHLVCELKPKKPSEAAAAADLRGDLDTIILKALAKEPERRYPSAEAFADDLRRHLDGLPVHARPATAGYRVRKFVERHKTGSLAALLVVLALVAGLGMALWQARVAERQRDIARTETESAEAVAGFLERVLRAPNPSWYVEGEAKGPDTPISAVLNEAARRIETDFAEQPHVRADLHHIVGDTYRALGLLDEAAGHFEQSLALRESLYTPPHPKIAEALYYVGATMRNTNRSASIYERAIAMQRARDEGNNLPYMLSDLANRRLEQRRFADADSLYREALGLFTTRYGDRFPATVAIQQGLIGTQIEMGNLTDAEERLDAVEQTLRRFPESRIGPEYRRQIECHRGRLALARGAFHEAEVHLLRCTGEQPQSAGTPTGDVPSGRRNFQIRVDGYRALAQLYEQQGRMAEAALAAARAEETLRDPDLAEHP